MESSPCERGDMDGGLLVIIRRHVLERRQRTRLRNVQCHAVVLQEHRERSSRDTCVLQSDQSLWTTERKDCSRKQTHAAQEGDAVNCVCAGMSRPFRSRRCCRVSSGHKGGMLRPSPHGHRPDTKAAGQATQYIRPRSISNMHESERDKDREREREREREANSETGL
jgi:hypothetical protein